MMKKGAIVAGAMTLALLCVGAAAWARGHNGSDREASPVSDPHGTFSTDTDYCGFCHSQHDAKTRWLSPVDRDRALCLQCHSGQDGAPNVLGDYQHANGASDGMGHRVTPSGEGLACTDCHSPHMDPKVDPGLLRVRVLNDNGRVALLANDADEPVGDTFCYSCHGPRGSTVQAPPPAPFGDFTAFEAGAHAVPAQMAAAAAPDDQDPAAANHRDEPTGGILCLYCHASHASGNDAMAVADQEELCYRCHSKADPNTTDGSSPFHQFNVAENLYGGAEGDGPVRIFHHPIASSEQQDGARSVECVSCHNPHFDAATDIGDNAIVANPRRTTSAWPVTATKRGDPRAVARALRERGEPVAAQPVTYGRWARALLAAIDAPTCEANRVAVVAWQVQEGTDASWNPLATTYAMPGATRLNAAGVRNYRSLAEGLEATRRTLEGGATSLGYGAILERLRSCAPPAETAAAISASAWCAGCRASYVSSFVQDVGGDFEGYADTLVAGGASSFSDPETVNTFCVSCHVAPDVTDPLDEGDRVPYDVRLVNDATRDPGGQRHDLFVAADYETSLHAAEACTACHDTHGSSNAYALRERVTTPEGAVVKAMTGFQGMDQPEDRRQYASFCLTCHQGSAEPHVERMLDQARYCRECHYHGADQF